jgi:hypothetical protein
MSDVRHGRDGTGLKIQCPTFWLRSTCPVSNIQCQTGHLITVRPTTDPTVRRRSGGRPEDRTPDSGWSGTNHRPGRTDVRRPAWPAGTHVRYPDHHRPHGPAAVRWSDRGLRPPDSGWSGTNHRPGRTNVRRPAWTGRDGTESPVSGAKRPCPTSTEGVGEK